ncbi:MAG: hypothetical protein J6D03_06995 [Clostridia bacterium]|nr:hypothetical protein [Clostridia bacterium]
MNDDNKKLVCLSFLMDLINNDENIKKCFKEYSKLYGYNESLIYDAFLDCDIDEKTSNEYTKLVDSSLDIVYKYIKLK